MNDNQPGQLITPQGSEEPRQPMPGTPEPDRPPEVTGPAPSPTPSPEPIVSAPSPATYPAPDVSAVPVPAAAPDANWQFSGGDTTPASSFQLPVMEDLVWTAAEFVEHEKSASWYVMLAVVGVVIAALSYLVSHDKITAGVIVAVMAGFGVFAARRPRTQQYRMSNNGILVGNKIYAFHDYKTFSVTEDSSVISIVFMPLKRFMPPLTIYVVPDMEEKVVNFLGGFMPFERHKADAVESLMRRIHF
jgi:hypothetical protein